MNRRISPVSSMAWVLLAVTLSGAAGATWLWPRVAWSAGAVPSTAGKPEERTSEKPPVQSSEKPSGKPLENLAEKPTEKPAEKAVEKPAEKAGEKPGEPIPFRRVYAPADRLKDWPYGKVTYMPIEAAEFERLLEVVGSVIPGTRTSFAAQLTSARYEARLVGGQSIEGTAWLEVVHSGESAALMPLDPCGLAIGKARWVKAVATAAGSPAVAAGQAAAAPAADPKRQIDAKQAADAAQNAGVPSGGNAKAGVNPVAGIDSGVEAETETAATLGLGTDDRLGVLVERSGQLCLDWSLVGRSDASGTLSYAFALPPCPTNSLVLDLPATMTPTVDRGELIEERPKDEGLRRWRIELGGHHRFILRVAPSDAAAGTSQLAIARESVTYDFSLPGVSVNAKVALEVHDQPLQKVALVLDPGLRLVTVRCGDASIPWSVTSTGDGQPTRVELTFPEAIRDKQCVLQIAALASLQVGRLWQLPRIRTEGAFWQEGTVTLWVPAPLVMQQLVPAGCRQTGTGLLSAPRVGETAEFQCFKPDAAVEVFLAQRPESVQVSSGTALELSGGEMTALVKAQFRSTERSLFSLQVDVAPQWMIDSVESLPAEALDDWTLERQNGSRQKLSVRLSNAVSSDPPLSLLITARRLHSPLGSSFAIRDLLPLQFEASPESKHLVAIEAVGPYQIELSGAERVAFIDSHSLDGTERELFDDLPRGLLLKNDEDATELRVALEGQKPSYAGTIHVEAIVGEGTLRENYVFRVVPKTVQTSAQRVRRIVASLGNRRDLPVHWTLGAEGDQQLSARRLSSDEQAAAGLDSESEVWELTLLRPRNADFELRASRDVELTPRLPIGLASLPEATSQQATLVVRSLGSKTARVEQSHLTPTPVEAVLPVQQQTARAMYRYDPTDLTATASATLIVGESGNVETPPAWGWSCHLESRYEADGTGRHLVTYRLQSSAGGTMRLTLPAGVTAKDVEGVWIDDNRAAVRGLADQTSKCLEIDLPPGEKFPTVSMHFTTPNMRLSSVGSLEPPLPKANLTVLSQDWTVWLPPGYETYDPDPAWQPAHASELTWSQRLFGALGRTAGQPPFDPTVPGNWSGTIADRTAQRSAARKAEQLLQKLAELAAAGPAGQDRGSGASVAVDWASILGHASIRALPLNVLVDRPALANAALTPRTLVRTASNVDPSASGLNLLRKADLAVLIHAGTVLVTAQTEAALYHAYLAPLQYQGIWRVCPGPLADRLQQAAGSSSDGSWISVDAWAREPGQPKSFWTRAGLTGRKPADTPGWTAYRLGLSDVEPVRLKYVHRLTMRMFGAVAFLMVVALGGLIGCHRPATLMLLGGVLGIAALVVPVAYVPVASGGVLAILFCLVSRLIRCAAAPAPPRPIEQPAESSTVSVRMSPLLPWCIACVAAGLALAFGGRALGADTPTDASPQPAHQVFVPVDAQQKPVGSKYYVPVELYNQLHRRAAAATEQPQGWLIRSATYRGVLSRKTTAQQFVVDELKAVFDLQVFGPTARVRLPLRREEANLLPDGISLGGRLIQPEWEADGGALVFEAPQPGQWRLELLLQPTMRTGTSQAGFDMTIPRLATSRLELTLPPGAPVVEVPGAIGSVRLETEPSRLVADLGPGGRLGVRWNEKSGSGGSGPAVDVEELLWLKVQPGSIVLHAKLKFEVVEGQFRQMQLATDPRLRLLPLQGDGAPTAQTAPATGQRQILTLQWPAPVSQEAVVEAQFLLTGTSGVGNLRMPELEVLGARPTRRWMAVWIDPALEHEQQSIEPLEALAVSDFKNSWGTAEAMPLFAYRLPEGPTTWSMSTRPREPRTAIDQTLRLTFDQGSVAVDFRAQSTTSAGYLFQHHLVAPANLRIEHLAVTEEGVQRASRWTQNKNGEITVFLSGPVSGRQELSLRGRLTTPSKGKVPLPTVQIGDGRQSAESVQINSSVIDVYRRPTVLVAIDGIEGLAALDDPAILRNDPELGRLVGQFSADPAKPIQVSIAPNRPQVGAEQIVRLLPDGGAWKAEFECQVHVRDGVVDQLLIDAPDPWSGPYRATADGPVSLKVVDSAGGARQLIVLPGEAIEGDYHLTVSGPLSLVAKDRPSVPRIELTQVDSVQRRIALPRQVQGRAVQWETRAMQEIKTRGDAEGAGDGSPVTYEAVGDDYQAVLGPPEKLDDAAQVQLADIRVRWQADGTCRGVASFDLLPGKSAQCPLWLPVGYRLVHVDVDGIPTDPAPLRPGVWQVPLGPEGLPQKVEVVFAGAVAGSAWKEDQRLDAPKLGGLPVRRTLWTVTGPAMFEPGETDAAAQVGPWSHDLAALEAANRLIESASARAAPAADETYRWYWPWICRLVQHRKMLEQWIVRTGQSPQAERIQEEIDTVSRQQSEIAQRLGLGQTLAQASDNPPENADASELWTWWSQRQQAATRCAFSEGVDSITLTYRRAEPSRMQPRLASAAGLSLLVLSTLWVLKRGTLAEWFRRWPCAVGVVVGLAWWLWLAPSILGWGIIFVSLAAGLLPRWRRAPAQSGSTVVSVRSQLS